MKKKGGPHGGRGEEMTFTKSEVRKIKQAMVNPEFQKYWDEYLNEITDPAGRKEREEFMLDQEKHHDLPPNTRLVRPEGGFCLKTYTRRLLSGQGPKKFIDQKLFINVCTTQFVEPPSKVDVMQNGEKMGQWNVPYTLSKPRADKDNQQQVCMTVDIIFNTKCVAMARFDEFRKMLCDMAIDAINTFLKEYNEKASQNYKVLKKLKYKGGTPEFILVKKEAEPGQSALADNLVTENHMPQAVRELYDQQAAADAKDQPQAEAEAADVDVTADTAIKEQHKTRRKRKIKAHNEEPNYTITETHTVELGECFEGPTIATFSPAPPAKKLPKALSVKIELPGVRNMKNSKLELKERQLKFEYLQNYILDAQLPYYVLPSTAKAKYDKDKELLTIEVNVDQQKYLTKPESQVVDLTGTVGRKGEEELEVEKVELPSLFNIYLPAHEEKKTKENTTAAPSDAPKLEVKLRPEPEPELSPAPADTGTSKALVQEIDAPDRPSTRSAPAAGSAEGKEQTAVELDPKNLPKVEAKYDFKQIGEYVIVTYKIKGYRKEDVVSTLTNNEMLLEVLDLGAKCIQRTCVTLYQPIVARESQVDMFVDYICIKLKKADAAKLWDSLGYQIAQLSAPPPLVSSAPSASASAAIPETAGKSSPAAEAKKEARGDSQAEQKRELKEEEKVPTQSPQQQQQETATEKQENERQECLEKAEDALGQKEVYAPVQFVHLESPIIYSIY
jgi:hypothetical protein